MLSYTLLSILPLIPLIPLTLCAPAPLYPRDNTSSNCSPFDTIKKGPYAVQNDIWGATSSGNQKQCSKINSFDGTSLAWSTTFTWTGDGNAVKTYANAEAAKNTPCKPLNQYKSMKTSWAWDMSADITGDVSYDAFLAPVCNGPGDKHPYEVMVWLAALGGLNPIGSPGPTVKIGSHSFVLWSGQNTQTKSQVFSFVATKTAKTFDGDLMDFFNYLTKHKGVDSGLKVTTVQAGTEVGKGSATFTTSKFSIAGS